MKTLQNYKSRQHRRLVRAVRNFGWKMTRDQQTDLIRRLEASEYTLVPGLRDRRFFRLQQKFGPTAAIYVCSGKDQKVPDVMCLDGVLTWDHTA